MLNNIPRASRAISYSVIADTENQAETIYTCPANCRAFMSLLYLTNADGNTTVDIEWVRESGTQSLAVLGGKNMTSGEYLKLDGAVIVFEEGDYMTITPSANTTPAIHMIVTVEEFFKPKGA